MADNQAEIAKIDRILSAGARSVQVDGVGVTYDFDELRQRKRELQKADASQRKKRPVVARINLGG